MKKTKYTLIENCNLATNYTFCSLEMFRNGDKRPTKVIFTDVIGAIYVLTNSKKRKQRIYHWKMKITHELHEYNETNDINANGQ